LLSEVNDTFHCRSHVHGATVVYEWLVNGAVIDTHTVTSHVAQDVMSHAQIDQALTV
jgi:hypothetical protein